VCASMRMSINGRAGEMTLHGKRRRGSILLGTLVLIAVACGVYFGFQKFVEYCNRDETVTATAQMQQVDGDIKNRGSINQGTRNRQKQLDDLGAGSK
jgi:hypothetical protein